MSTSAKHAAFIAEPLGEKPVTELGLGVVMFYFLATIVDWQLYQKQINSTPFSSAGIGKVLGERLNEQGFEKAYNLLVRGWSKKSDYDSKIILWDCSKKYIFPHPPFLPFGQYLLLNKDTETFAEWLKDEIKANKKQAGDCANCIEQWCQAFMT